VKGCQILGLEEEVDNLDISFIPCNEIRKVSNDRYRYRRQKNLKLKEELQITTYQWDEVMKEKDKT